MSTLPTLSIPTASSTWRETVLDAVSSTIAMALIQVAHDRLEALCVARGIPLPDDVAQAMRQFLVGWAVTLTFGEEGFRMKFVSPDGTEPDSESVA